MSDTRDKIVEMYAYQMLHLPEDSLAYQNTREDFAAMFRALRDERNRLREALKGANMNMNVVERKICSALKGTSHD
jgi:hypothetical protein